MSTSRLRPYPAFGALVTAALMLSACTAGSTSDDEMAPPPEPDEQVTLEVWSAFADRELEVFNSVLDRFHQQHPNITIDSVGNQDDDKITQAIRGGTPPDVAMAVSEENIGKLCSSGAWQDLQPYLTRDRVDLNAIPKAVRDYTEYQGTRCAMPMLADVYGLFYNTEAFAKAGITEPPKTTDELLDLAKRLTEWNPDGSIKVAGFLPVMVALANHPWNWAPHWDANWLDEQGRSVLGKDPGWAEMFRWQRELIDFYGWENLVKFTAGLGQTYSADNAFHRDKVAMMMDGEYRIGFIEDQAPDLKYATAPFPVSDSRRYGTGFATGSIIGIPKGAEHDGAAWELVRYLSTDKQALVRLANGLHNVPSTLPALSDPRLQRSEQYQTFLDIFAGDKLVSSPASPNGNAYMKATEDFADQLQRGKVKNLETELGELDKQIDGAKSLGG